MVDMTLLADNEKRVFKHISVYLFYGQRGDGSHRLWLVSDILSFVKTLPRYLHTIQI